MQGCSLSIREDLLNKYAEQMVNYCTTVSNNTLQDALASSIYLVNDKEQQILQLENKLDFICRKLSVYKEKHVNALIAARRPDRHYAVELLWMGRNTFISMVEQYLFSLDMYLVTEWPFGV